ncbi:MAG: hypothetical protein MJ016_08345 [Victivallaceae bacterium]|nr:hypothetical protein [Victivallaceae bacterium]
MKILVTAGPTREKIDPVRYITNFSSGKMGYALAREAARRGAGVVLVSGPVALPAPENVRVVNVESAAEMFDAVAREFPSCDLLVMAAAVADYRVAHPAAEKLKKSPGDLVLTLERTADILAEMGRRKTPGQKILGFAAESGDLAGRAREKLHRKNLDWIAANLVADGFGTDDDRIILLSAAGTELEIGPAPKAEIARRIFDAIL